MATTKVSLLVVCLMVMGGVCACQGGGSRSLPETRPDAGARTGAVGQAPTPTVTIGAITPALIAPERAGQAAPQATGGVVGASRQSKAGVASRLTPPPLPPYTPRAMVTQAAQSQAPAGGITPRLANVTPGARATVQTTALSSEQAAQVLGAAIQPIKGQAVRVTGAVGYAGSASVTVAGSVPLAAVEKALDSAVAAGGTAYYGMYQGVNQAVAVQVAGSTAAGTLTVLVEPQRAMPADAAATQSQLAALFPGAILDQAVAAPATMPELAGSDLYYGVAGNVAYLGGYAQYQGFIVAFVVAGSGSLQDALVLS